MTTSPRLPHACAIVMTLAATSVASSQSCIVYDANLGTRPDDQGWTSFTEPEADVAVIDGVLEVSTLPYEDLRCPGGSCDDVARWDRLGDFGDEVVIELRVHVSASEAGIACEGVLRPGFEIDFTRADGQFWRVGITDTGVFPANDGFATAGGPGIDLAEVDLTGGFHELRLEIEGADAALHVDGAPLLALGGLGPPLPGAAGVLVGDGTSWANSAYAIEWMAITAGTCCAGDLDGDGETNAADLLALLASWGPCPEPCALCLADRTGDCAVDVADLLVLLESWGPCGAGG